MKKVLALLLAAATMTAACGGESEADQRAEREYRSDLKQWKRETAAQEKCKQAMGTLRREVQELDGRIEIGLSFQEYQTQVGDVSAVYRQGEFEDAGFDCLQAVGLPLERALRQHERAYDKWGECIEDFDCDIDAIDPELQDHWLKAQQSLDEANRGFDRFDPGPKPREP